MKKNVAHSKTEITRLLRYQHLNSEGRLFGGTLMQWIDELAGIVAYRHSGCIITTAAVDSLIFRAPAFLGDLLVLDGCITYTGTTSMEVKVNTYIAQADGSRKKINKAYIVFVATNKDGTPVPVPSLELCTDEERCEWEAGQKRYDLRKMRRKEHY